MNNDLFVKGSHSICQDYAIIGEEYGFLSDGCSSSPHSEIGAHLVPFIAEQSFLNKEDFLASCKLISDLFPAISFDTTLIQAIYSKKEEILEVKIYGDGCIILKNENKSIEFIEIEYSDNAPFYVSYLINKEKEKNFLEQFPFNSKTYHWRQFSEKDNSVNETVYPRYIKANTELIFDINNHESIIISSDGIKSFRDNSGQMIDIKRILKEITSFKNYTGQFLQRRMNKMLKDFSHEGIVAYDDLSLVAFYFGKNDESL